MEISLISDTLTTVVTTHGLGFSNFLLNRNFNNVLSLSDSSSEQQSSAAGVRQISGVIFPVDALAPPPVKYNKVKAVPYDEPFGGGGGGGGRGWNFNSVLSLSDCLSEQQSTSSSAGVRQISSVMIPIDALAPPPVKYNKVKAAPRRLARKIRRIRRKSLGGGDEGDENGFLFDGGDYDGPFGGGGGGSGGRGWNFDGFGGANWEESSSFSDPAFDFVYELMCWAALSNCLHFAFKKVVRIVADGFSDPAREKVVPVRLTTVY